MKRRRWQVDLRLAHELTLAQARRVLGADGDSETLRSLLALFAKLSAVVENGTVIYLRELCDPKWDIAGSLRSPIRGVGNFH